MLGRIERTVLRVNATRLIEIDAILVGWVLGHGVPPG